MTACSCSPVMSTVSSIDYGKQHYALDTKTERNTISTRECNGQRDQNIDLERQNPRKRRIHRRSKENLARL
uniref:Uncharacterized protein n=1 Tax=Megaselia scalaris TaxID=36166 RepID=T1GV36_MEGSC